MEEILDLITSPVFWFVTIFLSLLLSIGANFATDGMKKYWGHRSKKQRLRNEAERHYVEQEALKCISNPLYFAGITSDTNHTVFERAVIWLVMGILLGLLAWDTVSTGLAYVVAVLMFSRGYYTATRLYHSVRYRMLEILSEQLTTETFDIDKPSSQP